jgi:uncharacterized protein YvpB
VRNQNQKRKTQNQKPNKKKERKKEKELTRMPLVNQATPPEIWKQNRK